MKTEGEVFLVEGTACAKVLCQEAAQKGQGPNRRPVWLETRQPPGYIGHLHFFLLFPIIGSCSLSIVPLI